MVNQWGHVPAWAGRNPSQAARAGGCDKARECVASDADISVRGRCCFRNCSCCRPAAAAQITSSLFSATTSSSTAAAPVADAAHNFTNPLGAASDDSSSEDDRPLLKRQASASGQAAPFLPYPTQCAPQPHTAVHTAHTRHVNARCILFPHPAAAAQRECAPPSSHRPQTPSIRSMGGEHASQFCVRGESGFWTFASCG